MLRVEGVVVRFGSHVAVHRVDLAVGPGETLAVIGPSGCGKTTLLRAIAGLQPLDAGRVTWHGRDLAGVQPHERRFGLMFQEYALFPHRDVAGNVEFGLRMAGVDREARRARVEEILALVGLAGFELRRIASLSGGEQQRVALARALAAAPELLMLDEPLGALDRDWRERLLADIRALLGSRAMPAIYVTHDHDEAFAIAHRVAVMRAGRIVQHGTPAELWRRPADVWTAGFLGFGPVALGQARDGMLQTPWCDLPVAIEPAGAVDVVLRPDAVRLGATGLDATVRTTTFRGTHVQLEVEPARGPTLTVVVRAAEARVPGDRVALEFDANAVLVYPRAAN